MKILDIRLRIDGLLLQDDENIDDFVKMIESNIKSSYPVQVDIDYEEHFDESRTI